MVTSSRLPDIGITDFDHIKVGLIINHNTLAGQICGYP